MNQAVTAVATIQQRTSLVAKFAARFSIDAAQLLPILKATAFKVRDGEATNEQMAALLVVADQYGLNPFTREIFAFPDKQSGIVPVVGVDGWSRIINDHPQSDGLEFVDAEQMSLLADAKPCPAWMECVIYRKDRAHPIKVREYLDEVYQPPRSGYRGPWQTHTKRMLRHKVLIQAARLAYGFTGIYDEDEAERIIERDVTPQPSQLTRGAGEALRAAVTDQGRGVTSETTAETSLDAPAAANQPETRSEEPATPKSAGTATDGDLGELKLVEQTSRTDERSPGTPKIKRQFLEGMAASKDSDAVGVFFEDSKVFRWTPKEEAELFASYKKRQGELAK